MQTVTDGVTIGTHAQCRGGSRRVPTANGPGRSLCWLKRVKTREALQLPAVKNRSLCATMLIRNHLWRIRSVERLDIGAYASSIKSSAWSESVGPEDIVSALIVDYS